MALVHHELCFGCGRTNLFGLLLEVERTGERAVRGRCFIKQDHQGATPGTAHEGVIAGALSDAMALACGARARLHSFEMAIAGPAPVGSFLEIEAWLEQQQGELVAMAARARAARETVATARGTYRGP